MILNRRSGSNQSQTMEALVPMVDLFAVLAIVFMIHSNEEITVTKLEKQEIVARLEAIDEAEQARRDRRELLAKKASKSLEQIKEERERKAQISERLGRLDAPDQLSLMRALFPFSISRLHVRLAL